MRVFISWVFQPGGVHRVMASVWQVLIWLTMACGLVTLLPFVGVPAAALSGTLAVLFTIWQTGAAVAILMTALSFGVFVKHRVGGFRQAGRSASSMNKDWQKDIQEAMAHKQVAKSLKRGEE